MTPSRGGGPRKVAPAPRAAPRWGAGEESRGQKPREAAPEPRAAPRWGAGEELRGREPQGSLTAPRGQGCRGAGESARGAGSREVASAPRGNWPLGARKSKRGAGPISPVTTGSRGEPCFRAQHVVTESGIRLFLKTIFPNFILSDIIASLSRVEVPETRNYSY